MIGKFLNVTFEAGIYFGMPEDVYHADPSLGSSDIKLIRRSPYQFWRRSKMNPGRNKYKKETEATILGTAMHKIVLQGRDEFLKTYIRRDEDIEGMSSSEKGRVTKSAKKNLREGEILLHADEFDLCCDTEELITGHPDMSNSLKGAATEVSMFWKDRGVPLKARYDILKPGGIGDIKSIANEREDPLDLACKYAIKKYRYYVQASHYLSGLRFLKGHLEAGRIYSYAGLADMFAKKEEGSSEHRFVKHCVDFQSKKEPGFQFIFVQKNGVPDTWACTLFPGNPILERGSGQVDQALDLYLANIAAHGSKPWPATWRMQELDMAEMPSGEFGWD